MEGIEGLGFLFLRSVGCSHFTHTAPSAWVQAAFAQCGIECNAGWKNPALKRFVRSARRVLCEQHLPGEASPWETFCSDFACFWVALLQKQQKKKKKDEASHFLILASATLPGLSHSLLMKYISTSIKMSEWTPMKKKSNIFKGKLQDSSKRKCKGIIPHWKTKCDTHTRRPHSAEI